MRERLRERQLGNGKIDLRSEEKRRQLTLGVLGGLLFATTLPVVNQRALFSPLGDVTILGDLTPTAYAATFGGPPMLEPGARGPAPGEPPAAYALRVPPVSGGVYPALPARGASLPPPRLATPGLPGSVPGTGLSVPNGEVPSARVPGGGGSPAVGSPGGVGLPGGGGSGGGLLPGSGTPSIGGPGVGTPGGGGSAMPGATGAAPEPATWLMMILGFGVIGVLMRRSRRLGRPHVVAESRST